jgi:uncharacterized protein (DUF1684 family)
MSTPAPAALDDLAGTLTAMRQDKDRFLREHPRSPLPARLRAGFRGLDYFPVDATYVVAARVVRATSPQTVELATSKGVPRPMLRYAVLEFDIGGVEQQLTAYKAVPRLSRPHPEPTLFVPFRDATSGHESYGAARYLDVIEEPGAHVVLDFNLGYSPYCSYSDAYECPLAPAENWLAVAIRAGEKAFKY